MLRRTAIVLGGASVYAGATLASYLYFSDIKDEDVKTIKHKERVAIYDQNARKYDDDIKWDERLMGINLMRKRLIEHSKGRVLEVCCGTGRNLKFYPSDCRITGIDASERMLEKAREEHPDVAFHRMEAEHLTFPSKSFDTVVDTFGLCSVDDPIQVLKEMGRMCKDDGQILLLEHGRSDYSWLEFVLDKYAAKHAMRWGCVWNRRILNLIEQAELEIKSSYRFHFNTTYYIIARPKQKS